MKIAIIGGGFTGLTAAYYLSNKKFDVTIFEKEGRLGGLADTYKQSGWKWNVEKHYHHWFTNDKEAISLIHELGLSDNLLFLKSQTSIYYDGHIYPFNSPWQVLMFSPLNIIDRIRTGLITLYLKLLPKNLALSFEKVTAYEWLIKFYGKRVFQILWEPLIIGKFGPPPGGFAKTVNMAWFWARIKKRSRMLGYIEGGYQTLINALSDKIQQQGGKILLNQSFDSRYANKFDKIIITTPSYAFIQMFPNLPPAYKKRLNNISHLHAINLLLVTKEKILLNDYWLNINDRTFPFLAVIAHTNFTDSKYYGGNHLTWIGNYLPSTHPYLKMTKEELFKLYLPYLKKINPSFNFELCPRPELGPKGTLNFELFFGPFAQPVFPPNYSQIKPGFKTPIKNIYLANMDMVYPWDRGTNYAIEMGKQVAEYILK